MRFEKPVNPNYAATVVKLENFSTIPKADKIQSALVFGNSVIVSKETKAGDIGLFFPVECQLSTSFVSANSLYRKAEYGNLDKSKTGYFENHRRVKCAKFLGVKSEGFWIPINAMSFLSPALSEYQVGDVFDKVNGVKICEKYVPKTTNVGGANKSKTANLRDSIVEGQFRFHFDTENLRKNIHKIQPNDVISISDKWHGTSAIFGKPLVFRKLSWFERVLDNCGVAIQKTSHGLTYSSRKMIKAVNGVDKSNNLHYYSEDIWGIVAKEIGDRIPTSYTIYGEIVGYTTGGGAIQAASGGIPYHYGCSVGTHKFLTYRVVTTNSEGKTLELSWEQMKEFCNKYSLDMVKELFYGKASDLVAWDNSMDIRDWQEKLLKYIGDNYVHDQMCPYNDNRVPAEGVVVRIDNLTECISFKLKNFRFLEDETKLLDKGVMDIETQEAEIEN